MNDTTVRQRSQSEEDFRTIVCNLTGIQKEDSVFERIAEEDKRIIKSAKKAIDFTSCFERATIKKMPGQIFNPEDLPRNK